MKKLLQWLFVNPAEQKMVKRDERVMQKPDLKWFTPKRIEEITMNDNVWVKFCDGRIEQSHISSIKGAISMVCLETYHHGKFYFHKGEKISKPQQYRFNNINYMGVTCLLSLYEIADEFIQSEKQRIAEHEQEIKLSKSYLSELEKISKQQQYA